MTDRDIDRRDQRILRATQDQEDATVTLDELRALLLVLREPEDATPRTAKERAWNRALDAVEEIAAIAAILPEHGGDVCTAHHSCIAYAESLYDAGLRFQPSETPR